MSSGTSLNFDVFFSIIHMLIQTSSVSQDRYNVNITPSYKKGSQYDKNNYGSASLINKIAKHLECLRYITATA